MSLVQGIVVFAWAVLAFLVASCGGGSACDSSACAAGNLCIDDGSGSGPQCHKVCAGSADCPSGWTCNDGVATSKAAVNWCVRDTAPGGTGGTAAAFPPSSPTGQWATPCPPTGGEANNSSCDTALGFACYGTGTTDAEAFCTRFGCTQDSDCPGSWWCATVNQGPNVTSDVETLGPTRTVCLPRNYCAPCEEDHDCAVQYAPQGTQQHCVADSQGAGFCSPQCATDANCDLDAECIVRWTVCTAPSGTKCASDEDCPPANGTFQHCDAGHCTPECGSDGDCAAGQQCKPLSVCSPRAGVCRGDGSFCSPCRSDDDCPTGYCFSAAPYSTERFCTTFDVAASCNGIAHNPPGCPLRVASDNWKTTMCVDTQPGQAECFGVVTLGTSDGVPVYTSGCWTVNR